MENCTCTSASALPALKAIHVHSLVGISGFWHSATMSRNQKKSVMEIRILANSKILDIPIFRCGDWKSEWAKLFFGKPEIYCNVNQGTRLLLD